MSEETFETPQPTPPTESKSTDWTKIILVSVLSLGLLAGSAYAGYWYGTQQVQQPEKPSPVVSQPQPEADRPLDETPEPTSPVADPTADWNTYQKEGIAFTFKYPRNVTLWGREENIIKLSLWGPTQKSDTEFYDGLSLAISLPETLGGKSLKEVVGTAHSEYKVGEFIEEVGNIEEMVINGLDGFAFSLKYIGNQTIRDMYFQSSSQPATYVQIVDATNDPTGQGFDKIVDQILSTFKFLD